MIFARYSPGQGDELYSPLHAANRDRRKTPWRNVLAPIKNERARLLGSPVARVTRAWGGYGSTPTFRLRLRDGRRAFFTGVNEASNDFMRAAPDSELRIHRELPHVLEGHAPGFLGSSAVDGCRVLLPEDVSPKQFRPRPPVLHDV